MNSTESVPGTVLDGVSSGVIAVAVGGSLAVIQIIIVVIVCIRRRRRKKGHEFLQLWSISDAEYSAPGPYFSADPFQGSSYPNGHVVTTDIDLETADPVCQNFKPLSQNSNQQKLENIYDIPKVPKKVDSRVSSFKTESSDTIFTIPYAVSNIMNDSLRQTDGQKEYEPLSGFKTPAERYKQLYPNQISESVHYDCFDIFASLEKMLETECPDSPLSSNMEYPSFSPSNSVTPSPMHSFKGTSDLNKRTDKVVPTPPPKPLTHFSYGDQCVNEDGPNFNETPVNYPFSLNKERLRVSDYNTHDDPWPSGHKSRPFYMEEIPFTEPEETSLASSSNLLLPDLNNLPLPIT